MAPRLQPLGSPARAGSSRRGPETNRGKRPWLCSNAMNGTTSRAPPTGRRSTSPKTELFPDVDDRRAGRAGGEVGGLRRALQGLLSGIRAHPAREGRRRLFGQGRARALPHLRERRSGLALDPEGPLRRDRARRICGDERGGAHVPVRPRAGHAQHGDLRHDGREPPRPDPALLPARIRAEGPPVRLGAQGLPHQRMGGDRGASHLRRSVHGAQRHRDRGDADLRLRDRLHQHAVPRPRRRRGGGRRLHLREPDLVDPDRRVAPRPDRRPGAAGADLQRPQGRGAEAGRHRHRPRLAHLLHPDRPVDGLQHAARTPEAERSRSSCRSGSSASSSAR